jgi:hypothetical protein
LSVSPDNISETGATTTSVITATLNTVSGLQVGVTLSTAIGGSTAGSSDFTLPLAINIAPGVSSGSVTLVTTDDAIDENSETVVIDIASVTNGVESAVQQRTVTIADTDNQPTVTLSVAPSSINESGATSTSNITATLTEMILSQFLLELPARMLFKKFLPNLVNYLGRFYLNQSEQEIGVILGLLN